MIHFGLHRTRHFPYIRNLLIIIIINLRCRRSRLYSLYTNLNIVLALMVSHSLLTKHKPQTQIRASRANEWGWLVTWSVGGLIGDLGAGRIVDKGGSSINCLII